jgi:hypothetical protein
MHITNSERAGYAASMGAALMKLNFRLRNMIFMRKTKAFHILNPIESLGIIPSGELEEEESGRVL